ncbi:MAG: HD domain-containing protein [Oscillospiraceae bacterium]|nr:HD domain-containing protein [Oscillospiraceae bacterium]
MEDKNITMARAVAAAVQKAGGRTYYVGGCVRDRLLGRETKDIDIEVHGIPPAALEEILQSLGEPMTMGASFGIMGLRHYELDIAMPRSEQATGRGHRDFAVFVDPFLGEQKAARRRDFTINAMMEDVLTGELLDFFGGREDIARRRIRHVDDNSFGEDPLRVFRAAQFAARFDFSVAPETTAISAGMQVDALAGERVMGELEKALQKAERPSAFFRELRKMEQLSVWFPELEALIGVEQSPDHHPEGDVWTHSLQVLDEAARLRGQACRPLWFMLSALCHDMGKPAVTEKRNGVIHAYAHETEGLPLVQTFLHRLTGEVKLVEYVLNMTRLHMEPNMIAGQTDRIGPYMKLYDRSVCPEDLLLLAKADNMGRLGPGMERRTLAGPYEKTEAKLRSMLDLYHERMARPYLMGRDLILAGLEPGEWFAPALAYAHKLRLAGLSKEEQLRQTLAYIRKEEREKSK